MPYSMAPAPLERWYSSLDRLGNSAGGEEQRDTRKPPLGYAIVSTEQINSRWQSGKSARFSDNFRIARHFGTITKVPGTTSCQALPKTCGNVSLSKRKCKLTQTKRSEEHTSE